jgi:uncharacterized membrane protein HdeD (DUF308 family)
VYQFESLVLILELSSGQMKWTLRILALVIATVCGIAFLGHICLLPLNYNFAHHRFYPGVFENGYFMDTMWLGLGFLCSGILYLYLGRKMRKNPN